MGDKSSLDCNNSDSPYRKSNYNAHHSKNHFRPACQTLVKSGKQLLRLAEFLFDRPSLLAPQSNSTTILLWAVQKPLTGSRLRINIAEAAHWLRELESPQ